MIEATRSVTVRDFVIFELKLLMDGLKDVVLAQVAIVALVVDLVSGGGTRPRLFYSVLQSSERFDLWLNLHGAAELLESGEVGDDGLFGASKAGSDTLLGKLEQMVRGGDEPRGGEKRTDDDQPSGDEQPNGRHPRQSRGEPPGGDQPQDGDERPSGRHQPQSGGQPRGGESGSASGTDR